MDKVVNIIADAFYNRNVDAHESYDEAKRLVSALDRAGYEIVKKPEKPYHYTQEELAGRG